MSWSFSITADEASPEMRRLITALKSDGLKSDVGRRGANELRRHFAHRQQDGPRNHFGAPSGNLWGDIRKSTNDGAVTSDGVTITVADPRMNQKVYGGTIRSAGKLLAIPARAEAYNKSPRLFSNLRLICFRSGAKALVAEDPITPRVKGEKRIGGSRSAGLVFYWLVDAVHQDKDPEALPDPTQFAAALEDTARKHLARPQNKSQS